MAKKNQQTPTAAPPQPANQSGSSAPNPSKVQASPSKPKGKKGKKSNKVRGTAHDKTQIDSDAEGSKAAQSPGTPKTPKKIETPQVYSPVASSSNIQKAAPSEIQKGKAVEVPQTQTQPKPNPVASTSNTGAAGSSTVAAPLSTSESSVATSLDKPVLLQQIQKASASSNPSVPAKISNLQQEIFRLAAATPVTISPVVERQFHESQLLLNVLEKVRGEHKKRQNYHGELDQDEVELRRSFVDKLAYVCDFKKGGSTVTALALQKTYQGVTFWVAANDTVKPRVMDFLQQILQLLKNVNSSSRANTESQLLSLVVAFNGDRLDYYWNTLSRDLPTCMDRLSGLEGSAGARPPLRELRVLKKLLSGLPKLSESRVDLVRECFEARKLRERSAFETLAQLTGSGNAYCKFFDDIRHLLGRLGEHLKATKVLVSAALRFPAVLDEFEIQARASPPARCFFQSPHSVTLDGMASRIFTKEEEITHYQEALETLQRTSNGALLACLRRECLFKTRIHAELLLADFFYWNQFDFVGDDPYIGCSKPACFNCFHYILAHPGNFILPACHNKLYLAWRTPDIVEDRVPTSTASRIREAITSKMNSNIRSELRRQIDGRYGKKAAQYDSVTGTSSSVQVDFQELIPGSMSEDGEGSPYTSAQEYPSDGGDLPSQQLSGEGSERVTADDSDDDLSWYQSRVEKVQLL